MKEAVAWKSLWDIDINLGEVNFVFDCDLWTSLYEPVLLIRPWQCNVPISAEVTVGLSTFLLFQNPWDSLHNAEPILVDYMRDKYVSHEGKK